MTFTANNGCTYCGSDSHMQSVCPWKTQLLTATGERLDAIAGIPSRAPGETDADLRARIMAKHQISAAQSAPAGEREAFAAKMRSRGGLVGWMLGWNGAHYEYQPTQDCWEFFQAGAAWQRTQSAGVPEGWRVMLDRLADTVEQLNDCMRDMIDEDMEDPDMERELCDETDELVQEARAMLAAAPAQPAAQCTNEDSWNCKYCRKTATCEALKDERNFQDAPQSAAHDQGEVQRLRELLGRALDSSDYATSTLRPGGNYPDEYVCHACLADTQAAWKDGKPVADGHKQISHEPDCWAEEARALLARLAASTGQEVKP